MDKPIISLFFTGITYLFGGMDGTGKKSISVIIPRFDEAVVTRGFVVPAHLAVVRIAKADIDNYANDVEPAGGRHPDFLGRLPLENEDFAYFVLKEETTLTVGDKTLDPNTNALELLKAPLTDCCTAPNNTPQDSDPVRAARFSLTDLVKRADVCPDSGECGPLNPDYLQTGNNTVLMRCLLTQGRIAAAYVDDKDKDDIWSFKPMKTSTLKPAAVPRKIAQALV